MAGTVESDLWQALLRNDGKPIYDVAKRIADLFPLDEDKPLLLRTIASRCRVLVTNLHGEAIRATNLLVEGNDVNQDEI